MSLYIEILYIMYAFPSVFVFVDHCRLISNRNMNLVQSFFLWRMIKKMHDFAKSTVQWFKLLFKESKTMKRICLGGVSN